MTKPQIFPQLPYRVDPNEEGTIQSADRAPSRIVEAVKELKGRKGPGDAR